MADDETGDAMTERASESGRIGYGKGRALLMTVLVAIVMGLLVALGIGLAETLLVGLWR